MHHSLGASKVARRPHHGRVNGRHLRELHGFKFVLRRRALGDREREQHLRKVILIFFCVRPENLLKKAFELGFLD